MMHGGERSQLRSEALCRGTAKLFSARWLRCSDSVLKTFCLTHALRIYFCESCNVTHRHRCNMLHTNKHPTSDSVQVGDKEKEKKTPPISFHLHFGREIVHIIMELNDRPPCRGRSRGGSPTINVEQHACACRSSCAASLSCFVTAQPRDSIWFCLPPTIPCRFSASLAIWELLSRVWAKYMQSSRLSGAPTSGGNHRKNIARGLETVANAQFLSKVISSPVSELLQHFYICSTILW